MYSQPLPHNQLPPTLREINSELEQILPGSRFREEVLRRAALTVAEARALAEVLDQLEIGVSWKLASLMPDRAAFGVRPLNWRDPV